MSPELAGRTVIVTGAGRGLGRAYALHAGAAGAAVVVNDVDGAEAAAVVDEIGGADAANGVWLPTSAMDEIDAIRRRYPELTEPLTYAWPPARTAAP